MRPLSGAYDCRIVAVIFPDLTVEQQQPAGRSRDETVCVGPLFLDPEGNQLFVKEDEIFAPTALQEAHSIP